MSQASEFFKNDTYVKRYYKAASELQAKMQGMDDVAQPADSVIQNILNGKE